MTNTARVLSVLACVAFALTLTGCPKKCVQPIEPVPPPEPTEPVVELPVEPGKSMLNLQTVYFDFDKSDVRPADAAKLRDNANQLSNAGNPMVTVEGHCDPVGTSEYNMALGMRRAEAAKAYLVKLGVPASQLATISYGEERLVTQNEAEYGMNRRAEFKVAR